MSSKKLVLNAAGDAATVSDATIGDIFTSVLDTNTALTGAYGFIQKVGLGLVGASVQNWRLTGSLNPFKTF